VNHIFNLKNSPSQTYFTFKKLLQSTLHELLKLPMCTTFALFKFNPSHHVFDLQIHYNNNNNNNNIAMHHIFTFKFPPLNISYLFPNFVVFHTLYTLEVVALHHIYVIQMYCFPLHLCSSNSL